MTPSLGGPAPRPEFRGAATVSGAAFCTLCDVIFLLRYVEVGGEAGKELHRAVTVLRTRGCAHNPRLCEFEIHDEGMLVCGPILGVSAILEGAARSEQPAVDRPGDL